MTGHPGPKTPPLLVTLPLLLALLSIPVARAADPDAGKAPPAAAVVTSTGDAAVQARQAGPRVQPADRAVDRLQLDTTSITGNRELPKVMSVVPWKAAEPPAGPDRPMGSLIEELLAPLDRDEFRREITYYRDLTSQSATPTTVASPGAQ